MATTTRRTRTKPETPPVWAWPDDDDRGRAWYFETACDWLLDCESESCRDELRLTAARSTALTATEADDLIEQAVVRVQAWRDYLRSEADRRG